MVLWTQEQREVLKNCAQNNLDDKGQIRTSAIRELKASNKIFNSCTENAMLQEARVLLNDENEKEGLTQYTNELKAPAIVKTVERDIQPTPAARLGLSDATLITVDEDYVVPSSDPATNSTPNSARTATESSPAPAKTAVPRELSNWAKVKKKVVSLFTRNRQKHG